MWEEVGFKAVNTSKSTKNMLFPIVSSGPGINSISLFITHSKTFDVVYADYLLKSRELSNNVSDSLLSITSSMLSM